MKLLLIAPECGPPWTEGRKNFVRDLLADLSRHAHPTFVTTGATRITSGDLGVNVPFHCVVGRSAAGRLIRLPTVVRSLLHTQDSTFDAVLQFPFGSFHGARGWINRWLMGRTQEAARGTNCLCLLYSVTRADVGALARRYSGLVTGPGPEEGIHQVHFGIQTRSYVRLPPATNNGRLLFAAGYAQNSRRLLGAILHERGLMDVLRAGPRLRDLGYRLTVAVPLLAYPERRRELLRVLARVAPGFDVEIVTHGEFPGLLLNHSTYLFPYRTNLTRFVPTSVLEAMASGVPVVCSGSKMLQPLLGANDEYANVYHAGDPDDIARTLINMRGTWPDVLARAERACLHVRDTWDISRSVAEILELLETSRNQGAKPESEARRVAPVVTP